MNTMLSGSLRLAVAAVVLTIAPFHRASAQTDFSPGGFDAGDRSLDELIEFPELRGDTASAVSCLGILQGNGKFDDHGCYRVNPGDDAFIAPILKVIKKARFQPATYDGRPVDVVFQYRVQFVKKGDDEAIRLLANPGYEENVDAYGVEHVAAQRVYGKESWQPSCPRQAKFLVLARANVDYDGRPGAVSFEHVSGLPITEKCRDALEQNLLDSRFIPAHADGEPVPSTYVEPFGN